MCLHEHHLAPDTAIRVLDSLQTMSEEQLKAFIEKVKTDIKLQEKVNSATTPEEGIEIAKAAGFSITTEDIQSMPETRELTDGELENVAGGRRGNNCGTCAPYQSNCNDTN